MLCLESRQMLNLKQVYIGDIVQVHKTFSTESPAVLAAAEKKADLSLEYFVDKVDFSKCELRSVKLSSVGINQYELTVEFVPWDITILQLPDYNLSKAVGNTEGEFGIGFESIEITSLVAQQGVTGIKEQTPPLLLPGTAYKLYGVILLFVILLTLLIRMLIKHKAVIQFIKDTAQKIKYRRNCKAAIRLLTKIKEDSEISAHEAAEKMQQIMRNYLEVRLDYPFTKTVTSEFSKAFASAVDSDLIDYKIEYCSEINTIFLRTDYLRYSNNAVFAEGEKEKLTESLISSILGIEKPVKIKKEEVPVEEQIR